MNIRPLIVFALLSLSACAALSQEDAKSVVVRNYLEAFNAHDAEAMASMVTEGIRWISIGPDGLAVQFEGKSRLIKDMNSYFDSCPTCRSSIGDLVSTDTRVSVVETASWTAGGELRSQRSLAVYEFSGEFIASVYYFADEP